MLATFLIGLREGLEASLVVGILIAYLVRTGRKDRTNVVWFGVGAAIALSLAFGAVLQFSAQQMAFKTQEAFGGVMSLIAVGFVTWMIFWMRRSARFLKADLENKMDSALSMGTGALVAMAFVAVAREGLETSLFIWSAAQATSDNATPLIGATLGLLVATFIGWLIYRRAVKINLAKFFKYTGALLVVVAAGVFAYGFHDLQEAQILPGLTTYAFNFSESAWLQTQWGQAVYSVLKGFFNFTPSPSKLEFAAWLVYLVPVLTLFLWPQRSTTPVKPVAARESARR